MKQISKATEQRIIDLYNDNYIALDIQEHCGVGKREYKRILDEAGVAKRVRGWKKIDKGDEYRAWKEDMQAKLKQPKQNTYEDARLVFVDNILRGSGCRV